MFEYNIDTIERLLKIEEFNLNKIDINKIKHVPMHQYRVSSKERPLLLIENLQVCIGLYAYSKNFAYAAHLNPVVMRGDEFMLDENKNIKYCNRITDLYRKIIMNKINDDIYIGISIGCNPSYETYEVIEMLNKLIDILIIRLQNIGINAIKLCTENKHIFIVDSINQKIITQSSKELIKK